MFKVVIKLVSLNIRYLRYFAASVHVLCTLVLRFWLIHVWKISMFHMIGKSSILLSFRNTRWTLLQKNRQSCSSFACLLRLRVISSTFTKNAFVEGHNSASCDFSVLCNLHEIVDIDLLLRSFQRHWQHRVPVQCIIECHLPNMFHPETLAYPSQQKNTWNCRKHPRYPFSDCEVARRGRKRMYTNSQDYSCLERHFSFLFSFFLWNKFTLRGNLFSSS